VLTQLGSLSRRAIALAIICTAAVVVLSLDAAGAQANYPLTPTIVITDANGTVVTGTDVVAVAQPLTVTANGWLPETNVTLTFLCDSGTSSPLGTFFSDPNGLVRETFNVPVGASGPCALQLSGLGSNGSPRSVQAPITVKAVLAAAATPSAAVLSGSLSRTGVNVWVLVQWGFALLSIGAVMVLAMRRYRSQPTR
jgi:hypothetical protein